MASPTFIAGAESPVPSDSLATRQSLLLRLQTDGPAREVAWAEFYDRYAPIIAGFARKLGVAPPDAADLVQQVMLGFYAAAPRFVYDPDRGRFRGYLKTCVWRAAQNLAERSRPLGGACFEHYAADGPAVDQLWEETWQTEQLHRAMEIVEQRYEARPDQAKTMQAFRQYVLLERPAKEVADELGISVASVHQAKSRVSRSLKQVFRELDDSLG